MQRSRPPVICVELLENRCLLSAMADFGLRHLVDPPEPAQHRGEQTGEIIDRDSLTDVQGQHREHSADGQDRGHESLLEHENSSRHGNQASPEHQRLQDAAEHDRRVSDDKSRDDRRRADDDQSDRGEHRPRNDKESEEHHGGGGVTRDRDRDEDRSSADRAHHDGNSGENGEEHHGDRDLGGGLGSDDDGGPATGGEHHGDNGRPGDSDQGHGSGTAGGDQVSGKDGQGDSTPPTGSTGEDNTTPGSHASGGDTGHSGGSSGGSQDSDSGSPASTDQDGTDAKPAPEHSNGHPQSGDGRAAPTAQEHVAAPSHDERAAAGTAPGSEMSKAERGTASPEKGAAEAALPTGAGGRTATDDRAAEDSARVGADAVFAQAGGNAMQDWAERIEQLAILPAEAAAAFSVTSLVPNAAELLSAYLPVDQEGIAAAMDRVLARIDDLGGQLIAPAEGMSLSPYLLSAIGAIAVYQIALRIRKPGAPVAGIQLDGSSSIVTGLSHWSGSTQLR